MARGDSRRRKPRERWEISRMIEFIASELDVDGAGKTHALWREGPSYEGPGTVWYARER